MRGSQPTYEGLKPLQDIPEWGTPVEGSQPTYEGLKPILMPIRLMTPVSVPSLPMRD